jgi:hypothetical protein
MICADTPFDHWQCGLRSSDNSYRFAEAEKHFRRALELMEHQDANGLLADVLIAYAALLQKMKRPQVTVAMYERRLGLKRFANEDRLERRCTAEYLAAFKQELGAGSVGT